MQHVDNSGIRRGRHCGVLCSSEITSGIRCSSHCVEMPEVIDWVIRKSQTLAPGNPSCMGLSVLLVRDMLFLPGFLLPLMNHPARIVQLLSNRRIPPQLFPSAGLGGLKETKMFLPHPRVKVSIMGSLRDREVACSASDRQGSNFKSCVWRTVSSQSSHHPQEVILAQFSLYVHKGGLKPDSFHFSNYGHDKV